MTQPDPQNLAETVQGIVGAVPQGTTVTVTVKNEHPPVASQVTCVHGNCHCKPHTVRITEHHVSWLVPIYEYPHTALLAIIGFFGVGLVALYTLLAWKLDSFYIFVNGSKIVTNTLVDNAGWLTALTLLFAAGGALAGHYLGSTQSFGRIVDLARVEDLVSPERAAELRRAENGGQ